MAQATAIVNSNQRFVTDNAVDRRQHRRLNTRGRVARLDALGGSAFCRLHDLSDTGARIETPLVLSVGDSVRIGFDSTTAVQGRVAWIRGDQVGVRLVQSIESTALIRKVIEDRWSGRARPPRLGVHRRATVTGAFGAFATVVGNVSERGLSICHCGDLAAGRPIKINFECGLTVDGTVRWSVGMIAGVELSTTLQVDKLTTALRR